MDNKKIIEISSGSVPKMDGTVKDLINGSVWFLYKVQKSGNPEAVFYLSADTGYLLKKDGSIFLKVSVQPPDLELGERVMFSDLPKPEVSKNYKLQWAF